MRIQIEPIQISIVRSCNEIGLHILTMSPSEIRLNLEFNYDGITFYSCSVQLLPSEIESFYENQLDMMQWIVERFNLKITQTIQLKRKEIEQEYMANKRSKFILYHRL